MADAKRPPLPWRLRASTARRAALIVLLTASTVFAACGGGGGGAPTAPSQPDVVDLGLQASTVSSRIEFAFGNPLGSEATITAGSATGPFVLDPAELPATVPADGSVDLGILFTPEGEGEAEGSLVVVYDGPGGHEEVPVTLRATGERVRWVLSPTTLDYGALDIGDLADRQLLVLNSSNLSPVTLTSYQVPSAEFTILGSPFPLTVQPGASATLDVRFAPLSGGVKDGLLRLGPNDVGGSVDIPLAAEALGPGSEVITDYGDVNLDGNGVTPTLAVSVPDDAISLFLEARADGGAFPDLVGLDLLTGPGGKVYENTSSTGDYVWATGYNVFTTQVPNTDASNVQLVPGGGTYQFRLKLLSGFTSGLKVRAVVERRQSSATSSLLPLNVWLAQGVTPTATTAGSDTRLQAVLSRVDTILSQQGIRLGDIDYYNVANAGYDDVLSESEFFQMLTTTSGASQTRLNLFFVNTALGGGIVGVAAMIAGPKLNGTSASGVMSIYDGYSTNTIGLIAAHEIGHFLGLYHTVEQDGSHDFIVDTANCPASGTNGACPTPGGGLLMHWQAVGGTTITDGQGLVVRGHPLVEPTSGGSTKRLLLPAVQALDLPGLHTEWCGTCRAAVKNR